MANSKGSVRTFHGDITLAIDYKGKRTNINPANVIYIMLDYNYLDNIIPIVYVSLSVGTRIYADLVKNKDEARIFLELRTKNLLSKNPVSEFLMSGLFKYIPSQQTPNPGIDLNSTTKTEDTGFQNITLGLILEEQVDASRKSFNGMYKEIDQATLIALVLEGTKVVLEPLDYNLSYEQFIIPPINTRYRAIEFLFNYDPFYKTQFRYFLDFDTSYLLSEKGVTFTSRDNHVVIDIRKITSIESMYDGVQKQGQTQYMYVNAMDARYSTREDVVQNTEDYVVSYSDETDLTSKLGTRSGKKDKTKNKYYRSDEGNLIKNSIDSANVIIEVIKANVDGSIFTPEKEYTIKNEGDYSRYDGRYLLIYKKVIYKSQDGNYQTSVSLGFIPVSDVQSAGTLTNTDKQGKTTSAIKGETNPSTLRSAYEQQQQRTSTKYIGGGIKNVNKGRSGNLVNNQQLSNSRSNYVTEIELNSSNSTFVAGKDVVAHYLGGE